MSSEGDHMSKFPFFYRDYVLKAASRSRILRQSMVVVLISAALPIASQTSPQTSLQKKQSDAPESNSEVAGGQRSIQGRETLAQLNDALESLAVRVSPAVVQILVTGYGPIKEQDRTDTALIVRQHAVGSGVIVDSSGYIMTNAHVVEGAQRIQVALPLPMGDSDGQVPIGKQRILDARLIGQHKETDLALLKINETGLPTLTLNTQQRPRVGQLVFAIGSPEGLQNSLTMGVVSAVARQADPSKPLAYIQTDAPINPGNSGGPLVDMDGTVLGINTFILSQGGGSEGLGFAIPARVVEFVYKSLRKHGHVHRVEIGAGTQEITPDLADALHLQRHWGIIVVDVTPDGPAEAAGLKIQDIILMADDRRIETLGSLAAALYLHRLDKPVKLEVLRGDERKTLYVPAIEHRDAMDQMIDEINPENSLVPRLGILAIDLPSALRSKLGSLRIPSGAVVVGRAADLILPDTGLQTGDIIHQLNGKTIDSVEDLRSATNDLKPGVPVAMQVERDGGLLYVTFEVE